MTAITTQTDLDHRARLFEPGERLGWVFRDRLGFIHPFPHAEPVRQGVPHQLRAAAELAKQRHAKRVRRTLLLGGKIAGLFFVLTACSAMVGASGAASSFFTILLLTAAVCGVLIGISYTSRESAVRAVVTAEQQLAAEYERNVTAWRQARQEHYVAERRRVDQLDEWGAARIPGGRRRIDIFGGSLWGWQAFLTVHGTSAMVERPVILVDLSQELVCAELAELALAADVPVDAQLLPDQLATTSLLHGLPPRQLVDALIESMYGDNPTMARSERSMDDRILTKVCDALGEDLSLGRVAAALRALMDEPDDSGLLTAKERRHITDDLFGVEYRKQAADALRRLEAYIQPMESLGTGYTPRGHGYLTCVALTSEGRNVRSELLTDIILQWLTHRIAAAGSNPVPDVIIAGADDIAPRNLERLASVCERRDVRLTLLFRHLRESGQRMIGGGAAAFMRLGNHEEATQAANYIGRSHKFVVSQLTKTLGGNDTHTDTDTDGGSDSESISLTTTTGWSSSSGSGSSSGAGGYSSSSNSSFGRTSSQSEGHTTTKARNWSKSRAHAQGTNWSDAESNQRVYEYAVEPTDLQHLPDHAMVLVEPKQGGGGPSLVAVEFDPAIVTLPRVSMQPLPELARPPQQVPAAPVAFQPAMAFQHTGPQALPPGGQPHPVHPHQQHPQYQQHQHQYQQHPQLPQGSPYGNQGHHR